MAVNWKDLKREIHDEVEKVWLKEPLEDNEQARRFPERRRH